MQTFERENRVMARPVCNSLIFCLPYSDQSIGLLDPNQGLIVGKSYLNSFKVLNYCLLNSFSWW